MRSSRPGVFIPKRDPSGIVKPPPDVSRCAAVELTSSYESTVPARLLARYDWRETRNAAAVFASTNRPAFDEFIQVLRTFDIEATDITDRGRNESAIPKRLNDAFRKKGWREGTHSTVIESVLRLEPYTEAGEDTPVERRKVIVNAGGYKIDNVKDRVVLDVEWHAKDGNLYRDVSTYRSLYDAGVIDLGVVLTRSFAAIRALSIRLGRERGFATTTTTNLEKLEPQLLRGDGGGCPILAVAITDRCYVPR